MKKVFYSLLAALALAITGSSYAIDATVAASMNHSVFLDNGNVYAMGMNNYYQSDPTALSVTSSSNVRVPVYTGVQNVRSVAANGYHSAALTKDGKIVIWGQLAGTASTKPYVAVQSSVPVTDMALTTTGLYFVAGGWLHSWGFTSAAPVVVSSSNNVKNIVAGDTHVLALHTDGTVSTIGTSNLYGQLGRTGTATSLLPVTELQNVVEIAANSYTSFARTQDGIVYGFGRNQQSQLGLNNTLSQPVPVALNVAGVKKIVANYASTFLLKSDNTVMSAGWHDYISGSVYNVSKTFTTLPGITGVANIHAGGQQTFVDFGTVGQVRGWGGNGYGQLGDTTNVERHTLTYAYYTSMPAYQEPVAQTQTQTTGTCGSIYSNPLSNASNSNNNGHACQDNGKHNGQQ